MLVCLCVCLSTQGLEELAERIFLKFCMKLDDVVNRRTTEPDFRFSSGHMTWTVSKMAGLRGF